MDVLILLLCYHHYWICKAGFEIFTYFKMNIEKLIELVKLKPILYTKEASGYKNNNLKKELWNQIGEELHMSGN